MTEIIMSKFRCADPNCNTLLTEFDHGLGRCGGCQGIRFIIARYVTDEEQQKIEEQAVFLKLAAEKKYQEERQKLIDKYAEELKTGNYNNELKAINDFSATQKLLYTQLYADQIIDKNTYDQKLETLDIDSKKKLLDVAQRYGINVTKAAQDLADGELKIMEDAIARKQALLKREADFRVISALLPCCRRRTWRSSW